MTTPEGLTAINSASRGEFVLRLGGVFEHSPWVAELAFEQRPFADVAALHAAMMACVRAASVDAQLGLIRAHPELAGREASAGTLTVDSTSEQGRLGFTALTRGQLDEMAEINLRYRGRFGFPCIVALTLHQSRDTVVAEMRRRIDGDRDSEIAAALDQIGHITRVRLDKIFS